MDLDPAAQAELQQLAALAHREIENQVWTNVRDPFTDRARAALTAMTARFRAAGVDRVIAEWATTHWVLGGRHEGWTMARCLHEAEHYVELGLIQPDDPTLRHIPPDDQWIHLPGV